MQAHCTHMAVTAFELAQDDHLASLYLQTRLRELPALQQELNDPHNGYVKVTRTDHGIVVETRTEVTIAASMAAAQAFILRRFW